MSPPGSATSQHILKHQTDSAVLQEPVLFATTIFENIAFGNREADLEAVQAAARAANAADFIERLPEGYHTQVLTPSAVRAWRDLRMLSTLKPNIA